MKKVFFVMMMAAGVMLASCGSKTADGAAEGGSTEVTAQEEEWTPVGEPASFRLNSAQASYDTNKNYSMACDDVTVAICSEGDDVKVEATGSFYAEEGKEYQSIEKATLKLSYRDADDNTVDVPALDMTESSKTAALEMMKAGAGRDAKVQLKFRGTMKKAEVDALCAAEKHFSYAEIKVQ